MNSYGVKDTGARLMSCTHRLILTVSGHRLLAKPIGMPVVELHTTGRTSALPRSCYLAAPIHDSCARRKMHARTASAQEKAELWPRVVAAYAVTPSTSDGPAVTSRWSSASWTADVVMHADAEGARA